VVFAAWLLGRTAGALASIAGAALGVLAELTRAGPSAPAALYGDFGARLWVFLTLALLTSSLRRAWGRERELSRVDYLTGAANARGFHELLAAEAGRSERHGRPLTLAYFDIDDFKTVNDRFGHAAGDAVLALTARSLQRLVRATDSVGRLGGDEFAVLLSEAPAETVRPLLEKIQRGVSESLMRQGWNVTLSAGAVTFPPRHPPAAEMLRRADELMYSAKKAGKNRIEYESLDPRRKTHEIIRIEPPSRIRSTLALLRRAR
jgi:diguanylate cyclase (GGDEF)-like protein